MENSEKPLPDFRDADDVNLKPQKNPAELRAQARELDEAHHAESTFHLSDESIKRAGIREPAFRPVVDEKTGAHTGELRAAPVAEVHG